MNASLQELLRRTSRSFYLTLRVLPTAVRPQIGLAYLLARTSDTIADTDLVSVPHRLQALQALRGRILGEANRPLAFGELSAGQALPAEKFLLEQVEESLCALETTAETDHALIRQVLQIIISGQELDLQRFGAATMTSVKALETDDELDDYTYRVAGCVGEFWTRLCRAHLFPHAAIDDRLFLQNGVRFGKGLQLINILRDLPADLRQGRCYLPRRALEQIGLTPADLLSPANDGRLRPVYQRWLETARQHLAAGWDYTNSLPSNQWRLRLACAWPVLIGAKTLAKLRRENVLDGSSRIKVSRSEVRRILARSVLLLPFESAWRGQYEQALKGGCNNN